MAELLLDIPLMDFIAAGIAFCGITSAFLIQCGDKRTARKKVDKSKKVSQKSIKAKKSLRQTESKDGSVMSSKKSVRKSEHSVKPGEVTTSSKRTEVSAISSVRSAIPTNRPANAASSEVAITEITPAQDQQLSLKSAKASKRSNRSTKSTKSTQEDKPETNVLTAREPAKQIEAENELEKTVTARPSKSDLSLESLKSAEYLKDLKIVTLVPFDAQTGREVSKKEVPLHLQMEPKELQFSGNGGLMRVQLHNPTDTRRAIKIKCTDNAIYRVNPVYGYLEPGENLSIEVVRQSGVGAKSDKLVVVTAKAPLENMSVKDVFKSAPKGDLPLMTLPLRAA